jgi:hypothetical protein
VRPAVMLGATIRVVTGSDIANMRARSAHAVPAADPVSPVVDPAHVARGTVSHLERGGVRVSTERGPCR